jgi:hypothetical protein
MTDEWINIEDGLPEQDGEYEVLISPIAMNSKPYIALKKGHWYEMNVRGKIYKNFSWNHTDDKLIVIKWKPKKEVRNE